MHLRFDATSAVGYPLQRRHKSANPRLSMRTARVRFRALAPGARRSKGLAFLRGGSPAWAFLAHRLVALYACQIPHLR